MRSGAMCSLRPPIRTYLGILWLLSDTAAESKGQETLEQEVTFVRSSP